MNSKFELALSALEGARCVTTGEADYREALRELRAAQLRIAELEDKNKTMFEKDFVEGLIAHGNEISNGFKVRAEVAEAELARRDAAAGEPVAWISERNLKDLGKAFSVRVKHEPVMVRPIALYTAAQQSALPPERKVSTNLNRFEIAENIAYNQAIADAKALGCKAIKLAKDLKLSDKAHQSHVDYAEGYNDRAEMDRQALRALGFTVECE